MGGLFTCQIKKMALGKFDGNPLKTQKPEFQQGRQEYFVKSIYKVDELLSNIMVSSSFFPLVGGVGSFVFDKKQMLVN